MPGSVNAAAQSLHLTQPSLARQLHRLERRLGLPLLELRGGRTVLTEIGHQFLPYARALLATADATLVAASLLAANLAAEDDLPRRTRAPPDACPADRIRASRSVRRRTPRPS